MPTFAPSKVGKGAEPCSVCDFLSMGGSRASPLSLMFASEEAGVASLAIETVPLVLLLLPSPLLLLLVGASVWEVASCGVNVVV